VFVRAERSPAHAQNLGCFGMMADGINIAGLRGVLACKSHRQLLAA